MKCSNFLLVALAIGSAVVTDVNPLLAQASATGVKRQIGAPENQPRSGVELEQITEEVSSKLRCPVCQGMSVADSPSESARAMKAEIQDLLATGYSEPQVKGYFESTYGEFVLLDPKRKGLNWLVWLAPALGFFGGLTWLLVWNKRRPSSEQAEEGLDQYLEQVRSRLENHP